MMNVCIRRMFNVSFGVVVIDNAIFYSIARYYRSSTVPYASSTTGIGSTTVLQVNVPR